MTTPQAMRRAVLGLALGLAVGCIGREVEAWYHEESVLLEVVNQNFLDADLFAVESNGFRRRVGFAPAQGKTDLWLAPWQLGPDHEITVDIHLIGGANLQTNDVIIQPGQYLVLTVAPALSQSTLAEF